MTLFISQLNEHGRPKNENLVCRKCGRKFKFESGFNKHKSIHRVGPDSYHDKDNLYKSGKWTYET